MTAFQESPRAFRGPFQRAYTGLSVSTRSTPLTGVPGPIENEIPISQLPLAGPPTGAEQVAVVQNGITCRTTTSVLSVPGPAGPQGPQGGPGPPGPPGGLAVVDQQVLTILTLNTLPNVRHTPIGGLFMLIINGTTFSLGDGSFTVSGQAITWTSPSYSVQPGDSVVAIYSYAG